MWRFTIEFDKYYLFKLASAPGIINLSNLLHLTLNWISIVQLYASVFNLTWCHKFTSWRVCTYLWGLGAVLSIHTVDFLKFIVGRYYVHFCLVYNISFMWVYYCFFWGEGVEISRFCCKNVWFYFHIMQFSCYWNGEEWF